jgi:hypothetical protein
MLMITLRRWARVALMSAGYAFAQSHDDAIYRTVAQMLVPQLENNPQIPDFNKTTDAGFNSLDGKDFSQGLFRYFVAHLRGSLTSEFDRKMFDLMVDRYESRASAGHQIARVEVDDSAFKLRVFIHPGLRDTWVEYYLILHDLQTLVDRMNVLPSLMRVGIPPERLMAFHFLSHRRAMTLEWLYLQQLPQHFFKQLNTWLVENNLDFVPQALWLKGTAKSAHEIADSYITRQIEAGRYNIESLSEQLAGLSLKELLAPNPCQQQF